MRYAEYFPAPRLASVVERFWLLEGPSTGIADAIIPDGRVELVFHYGGAFWRQCPSGGRARQPSSLLVGQMGAPGVPTPEGHAGAAAIRLRPSAGRSVLKFALSDVSGQFVDLESIFPSAALVRE